MTSPTAKSFIMTLPDGRKQRATQYVFDKSGDVIEEHSHAFWHSCFCSHGSVEVFDSTGKIVVMAAGEFTEFSSGRMHGIRATQDMTETFHISEPGVVEHYECRT